MWPLDDWYYYDEPEELPDTVMAYTVAPQEDWYYHDEPEELPDIVMAYTVAPLEGFPAIPAEAPRLL